MGGTGSMKVNVFKCRRNSADVGVQVLAALDMLFWRLGMQLTRSPKLRFQLIGY